MSSPALWVHSHHSPWLSTHGNLTEDWVRAHSDFHDALSGACGSPRLLDYLRTLLSSTEFYQRLAGIPDVDHEIQSLHLVRAQA